MPSHGKPHSRDSRTEIARSPEIDNPDRRFPETSPQGQGAVCLVDLESGKFVAVDQQVALWLNIVPAQCGQVRLSDMIPAYQPQTGEQWFGSDSASDESVEILLSNGQRESVRVRVTRLENKQSKWLLLSFLPQGTLERKAEHVDPLTGLPDRRQLTLQRQLWQENRPDQPLPHAVLFVDLDNFKQVNDRYGHPIGDRVLATLAQRWQTCVREGDVVVRYGGDEFVVLVHGVNTRDELDPIVQRLLNATAEPIKIAGKSCSISATIGIATADNTSADLASLITAADRDMYAAKRRK